MNKILYRVFSVVDECPFCKGIHLIHVMGIDEISCVDCQKKFTKQQAEEMTGVVKIVRGAYR